MNSELHYIALADQVRAMRELSQQWRRHRDAFDWTDEQRHERAKFEVAYRAGLLRGKPSAFQTLPGEFDA
jgi:hypothetical protein